LNQKLDECPSPHRQSECKFEALRQEYFAVITELSDIKKLINTKFKDFVQPDLAETEELY